MIKYFIKCFIVMRANKSSFFRSFKYAYKATRLLFDINRICDDIYNENAGDIIQRSLEDEITLTRNGVQNG